MTTLAPATNDPSRAQPPEVRKPTRVLGAIVLLAVFWGVHTAVGWADLPIKPTFLSRAGACALLTLVFPLWWLTNRSVRMRDRWLALGIFIAGCAITIPLCKITLGGAFGVLFSGLPFVFTAWTAWLVAARQFSPRTQRLGLAIVISLVWMSMTLVRMDGLTGDLKATVRWRWSPRPEDAYLATRSAPSEIAPVGLRSGPVMLEPGDWPSLRGPGGNGQLRGTKIAADWTASPPKMIWRERIGPAWSSPIVVGGRLFTQEQVGEMEAVVCLDPETGKRIWSHEDKARLRDAQGGDGPRGTPMFSAGRLYTQGGTGILNCLDATDGHVIWSRDIVQDSGASVPMWGFSASPLVTAGVVITFAGGKEGKGLLAYDAATGKPVWTASTGSTSYCSPELVSLDGKPQVLFLSDAGLVAVDPASGKLAWQYEAASPHTWRAVQPAAADPLSVLVGSEDLGLVRLDISRSDGEWKVAQRWASKATRPGYNDFAIYKGNVYGFDGSIFCCVNLDSGKRRWKQGRYGHGQALLLADQGLLLVTSETGEAVLLEATPERHRELGRFQAISGKTWNHPVIAHGRLYVRNDEEIACYALAPEPALARKP